MSRNVAIIGCGMSEWGHRKGKTLMDLLFDSSSNAISDADINVKDIDAIYVASMLSGELSHQTAIGSALADQLNALPCAADRVENGPASGGSAVKNGILAVASGLFDIVLITGGEKMRDATGVDITDTLATMTHPAAEYIQGVTLPSLAALFTRLYMQKYPLKPRHLAMIAVKNHKNALKNPYAHIHRPLDLKAINSLPEAEVNNPLISSPLRLFDLCPVTDGAASLILCPEEKAKEFSSNTVVVAGFGQATDTLAVQERKDPTRLRAVAKSAEQAFSRAGINPADIDVAELHDAFTVLEIAESEEIGFFDRGEGYRAVEEGVTALDGELPINPSGGLKARGHPVGATGVAQLVELTWQLRGDAGERQVEEPQFAYSCNFGGFGNNVLSFILRKGD